MQFSEARSTLPMTTAILSVVLLGLLAVTFLLGCTSVGRGSATLIPKELTSGEEDFAKYFPGLVATAPSMRPLTPGASTDSAAYRKFLENNQGCVDCQASDLSVVVRDRTKTPPFLPVDVSLDKELVGIYLNKDLSSAKKEELAALAKAQVFNVPDLPSRTTLHESRSTYYYYPRIEVNFSSKLNTTSPADRFAYLGMVLRITPSANASCLSAGDGIRFLDFHPKAADIYEFARGEFTQKTELAAKQSLTDQTVKKVAESAVEGGQNASTERTHTGTITPELSLTMSETFVNALKDSIEARTTGILEEGQAFFADFRSTKNRRIGGTYSFDLMLEVPATLKKGRHGTFSNPCTSDIRADA